MQGEKSSFIRSFRPGDHFLVVYENPGERDLLAILFIEGALKRKEPVVLFLETNSGISRLLGRKKRGKLSVEKKLHYVDSKLAFGGRPNLNAFRKFYNDALGEHRETRLSLVGEFPLEFYGSHQDRNEIEAFIDGNVTSKRPTFLCLASKNQMFSVEPGNILDLIRTHDSFLLEHTPIAKNGGHYSPPK